MSSTARALPMLALCVLAACGEVRDADDGGSAAGGDFTIAVTPERLYVRQGGTASAEVSIDRDDPSDAAIEITLEIDPDSLPAGVSAEPLTIPAGDEGGTLTLTAAADAIQGAVDLDVSASAGDISRMAGLRLLVAGPPGTVDESFADDGIFTARIGDAPTAGNGITVQPDGKIVVTGSAQSQAIALRLDPSGRLDPTFGEGGIVSTGAGDFSGGIMVKVLSTDQVILGGWGGASPDTDLALFGLTEAGIIDEDFAQSGAHVIDIGDGFAGIVSLLENDAGDLFSVGTLFGPSSDSAQLARFTTDGTPDPNFGATLSGPAAQSALLLDSARILVAGSRADDFWLARFDDDGFLDPDFGLSSGATQSDLGGIDFAHGLVPVPGGKFLAIGKTRPDEASPSVLALVRYNSNGTPDLTFAPAGELVTTIPFDTTAPSAAILDSEGRILVSGHLPDAESANLAVLRLQPDATPDDTFGDSGRASIEFDDSPDPTSSADGVALDPDGRILLSGETGANPATQSLVVTRLWP
jgi:uncharacterized delta-60 repeat protein